MSEFNREYIPMSLRLEVYFLDNFTCVYCGVRQPNQQIDHRLPVTLGGPSILENLVTCCFECNMRKGNRPDYKCNMIAMYGRFSYAQSIPELEYQPKPLLLPRVDRSRRLEQDKSKIVEMANMGLTKTAIAKKLGGNYQKRLRQVKEVLED